MSRPDTRKNLKYHGTAIVRFVDNYDGDTFRFDCDAWPTVIGRTMVCRIANIDAPERSSQDSLTRLKAMEAKSQLYRILSSAKVIKLYGIQRGKYFRIVSNVLADNKDVGELLLTAGVVVKI